MRARLGAGIAAAISLVLALLFSFAFYDGYWQNRACFEDTGSCWVSADGVTYTTNSVMWGPLAVIFALLFVIGTANAIRR